MLPEMKVAEITFIVYVCEAANENKVHMVAEIGPMERVKEFQNNPEVH
jgi:nucleoside-triphosphatase THEP1